MSIARVANGISSHDHDECQNILVHHFRRAQNQHSLLRPLMFHNKGSANVGCRSQKCRAASSPSSTVPEAAVTATILKRFCVTAESVELA
jgi:hypothetical protein